MFKTVLHGSDGSEPALQALALALSGVACLLCVLSRVELEGVPNQRECIDDTG